MTDRADLQTIESRAEAVSTELLSALFDAIKVYRTELQSTGAASTSESRRKLAADVVFERAPAILEQVRHLRSGIDNP